MIKKKNNIMIFKNPGNILFGHDSLVSEFLRGVWKLPSLSLKELEIHEYKVCSGTRASGSR